MITLISFRLWFWIIVIFTHIFSIFEVSIIFFFDPIRFSINEDFCYNHPLKVLKLDILPINKRPSSLTIRNISLNNLMHFKTEHKLKKCLCSDLYSSLHCSFSKMCLSQDHKFLTSKLSFPNSNWQLFVIFLICFLKPVILYDHWGTYKVIQSISISF